MEESYHCLSEGWVPPRRQSGGTKAPAHGHRYTLLGDVLYKKSYSKLHAYPYLRYLGLDEARRVIQEIHDGNRGNHSGGRFLAHKVIN